MKEAWWDFATGRPLTKPVRQDLVLGSRPGFRAMPSRTDLQDSPNVLWLNSRVFEDFP